MKGQAAFYVLQSTFFPKVSRAAVELWEDSPVLSLCFQASHVVSLVPRDCVLASEMWG